MIGVDATSRCYSRHQTLLADCEEPHALLVPEKSLLPARRPDRIPHIAGELVVERFSPGRCRFGVVTSIDHLQLGGGRQSNAREADTARAHDAAIREQGNLVTELRLVGRLIFVVDHSLWRGHNGS